MQTISGPWVDVDLGALCANYDVIAALAPAAEAAAVVKCNAYGLGADACARALAGEAGCETFFVTYPEEGANLRRALKTIRPEAPIYVFNGPSPDTLSLFRDAGLTPVLNTLEQATLWAKAAPGESAALHVDTGMNRLGAPEADLERIVALDGLRLDLVMSHLACIGEPEHPKNIEQLARFKEIAALFPDARKSLAASGGALTLSDYHFDLLRLGVALYGGSPFIGDDARIRPVASLRAPVIQVAEIGPGEIVGYGATYQADKSARIATVALGYGDGFPCSGANRGEALLGGARVKIAGRVSMDLITLDVTDLPQPPKTGDIATFFGKDISVHEAAIACGTNSYELLTRLGPRAGRRYQ